MQIVQHPEEKKCEFCGATPAKEENTVITCSRCSVLVYKAYLDRLTSTGGRKTIEIEVGEWTKKIRSREQKGWLSKLFSKE